MSHEGLPPFQREISGWDGDAEGRGRVVWGTGGGIPVPNPLGDLKERRELSQWGPRQSSRRKLLVHS